MCIRKYDYRVTAELQWVLLVPCKKIHKLAKFWQKYKVLCNFWRLHLTEAFSLSHILKSQVSPLLYGCTHTWWLACLFCVYIILVHLFVHPQFKYLDLQTEWSLKSITFIWMTKKFLQDETKWFNQWVQLTVSSLILGLLFPIRGKENKTF